MGAVLSPPTMAFWRSGRARAPDGIARGPPVVHDPVCSNHRDVYVIRHRLTGSGLLVRLVVV